MSMADVGAGVEEAVVTFEGIAVLTPRFGFHNVKCKTSGICYYRLYSFCLLANAFYRGRYSVELHLSFLRLQGQANDFKIQYSSVVRLFLLPKVFLIIIWPIFFLGLEDFSLC